MWYVRNVKTNEIARWRGYVRFFLDYRQAVKVAAEFGPDWTASIGTERGDWDDPV